MSYRYTKQYSEQQKLNVPKYLDEVKAVLSELDYHFPRSKSLESSLQK